MTTKTIIFVNPAQYNQVFVDDLKVEFVPTYEHGSLVGVNFRLSDINTTNPCLVAKISITEEFDFKAKVRGRHNTIVIRMKGSMMTDDHGMMMNKVTFMRKDILQTGCFEMTCKL